ncbi:MAG: hypothetical protein NW208_18235 [Bryobacter sp.]|nr:hypothetical protein [Bryobacter sp.]
MGDTRRIVILGEDQAHRNFARGLLLGLRYERRDLHEENLPAGGSGQSYVIRKYPEVREEFLRKQRMNRKCALIAFLDLDSGEYSLTGNELCLLIAYCRRNVETWIHALIEDDVVDEETNYKPRQTDLAIATKAGGLLASALIDGNIDDKWPTQLRLFANRVQSFRANCQLRTK